MAFLMHELITIEVMENGILFGDGFFLSLLFVYSISL